MEKHLEKLNEQQHQAVVHGESPLLILAGAGSGKTRVITTRIAYLIEKRGYSPYSILAVTFTNKAAAEMRERAVTLTPQASNVMIKTFHSFGAWFLRRNSDYAGISPQFTIYDDTDSLSLLKSIAPQVPTQELKKFTRLISRAKDECLTPDDNLTHLSYSPDFPLVYAKYEKRLREIGNVDFGDLIALPVKILVENSEVRERYAGRFRAILVDEYQDSNPAQYQLLQSLYNSENHISVVGDDDQSIYRFRGAMVENILTFQNKFPNTEVVKLEENYRSTGHILKIASSVVNNNDSRMKKRLWTRGEEGKKAQLYYFDDQEGEAEFCANLILREPQDGETAILYRTNSQSRTFESCFRRYKIPYRLVGSLSFYRREEVKDALSYLALLQNPKDEIAFGRVANKPTRGIGKQTLKRILDEAVSRDGSLISGCLNVSLKGKAEQGVKELLSLLELKSELGEYQDLGVFLDTIIRKSRLSDLYHEKDEGTGFNDKLRNLDELINMAARYPSSEEGLTLFLESVELDSDTGEQVESEVKTVLITMHNTKGLEFERVIITGVEDEILPGVAKEEGEIAPEELEEERRLFYVSITRARKELYMTCCTSRHQYGRFSQNNPSRFLEEIPKESIDVYGEASVREAALYRPGVSIYHSDYGQGVIRKSEVREGYQVLSVYFESGRFAKIMPQFCEHKIEVLGVLEW